VGDDLAYARSRPKSSRVESNELEGGYGAGLADFGGGKMTTGGQLTSGGQRSLSELPAEIGTARARSEFMKNYDYQASSNYDRSELREKGLGPNSAGQSGDTQGLSEDEGGDSESVVELLEEGQAFEAEAVGGVEDAADADVAEVHTKQFPEDDVPLEYLQGEQGDQ